MLRRTPRAASAALPLAALLSSSTPAGAQTLVAHWELNETAGTTCSDSSPNLLHGTYRGGYTLGLGASTASCGTAVDFDDTQSTDVLIAGAPPLDSMTSDLTVAAWIWPETLPPANAARRVFGNNNGGWMCGLWGDGMIFTTRWVRDYLVPSAPIPAQAWTHVAFVFDAAFDVTFYVNGAVVAVETGSSAANLPNPEWFIGGFDGSIEFFDGLIDDVQVYQGAPSAADVLSLAQGACTPLGGPATIGVGYCGPVVANSTGGPALVSATGSAIAAANDLTLHGAALPANAFAFFLTSRTRGFVAMPGGSSGNLCLGGAIGRFVGPGQIQNSGAAGQVALTLDLTRHPTPTGFVAVQQGDTWNFQCWYRDAVMGAATSNFSDGLEVTFQ